MGQWTANDCAGGEFRRKRTGKRGLHSAVMDITNTIKNLYNNRVTRFYNCKTWLGI